jgi:hypothetical protein
LIFLTARSRAFEPIAADILGKLDRSVRQRLDDKHVEELKTALRELLSLGGHP